MSIIIVELTFLISNIVHANSLNSSQGSQYATKYSFHFKNFGVLQKFCGFVFKVLFCCFNSIVLKLLF